MDDENLGNLMYRWVQDLFPICRSLTGQGVRETLSYLQELIPELTLHEIPTGTKVGDWNIPKEWKIKSGFVENLNGQRLIDFDDSNLHVVGYSTPVDQIITKEELEEHLYSLPKQPDAIPYITSYYKENWGFCLTERARKSLGSGPFKVKIDSELFDGNLTYGELVIPGDSKKEVLISTYVCHPSMANNELSGPAVATSLAIWLSKQNSLRYTYRFLFIPETIGSIAYISTNLQALKDNVIAGWVLTCIGDDRTYSFLPSRTGETLADKISLSVLDSLGEIYKRYSFLDRGSDERQWCWPGVDLPVCSIMRSKYGEYPEYHTSLDDLSVVSPEGLLGGFNVMKKAFQLLEKNFYWKSNTYGEPQMGKRGLYPSVSTKESANQVRDIKNVLTYADGLNDVIDISRIVGLTTEEVIDYLSILAHHKLIVAEPKR